MSERRANPGGPPRLLLPALAWIGAAALGYLLLLGPSLGTSAPAYSSLRTDPQGASALFGAYARAGLRVERGYTVDALDQAAPADTAVFVLAPQIWPSGLSAKLAAFAAAGGEVVLAGLPQPARPPAAPPAPQPKPAQKPAQGPAQKPAPPPPKPDLLAPPPEPDLAERLGVKVIRVHQAFPSALPSAELQPLLQEGARVIPLVHPETALAPSRHWTPLYSRDNGIYVAARTWGKGWVIVASEATFLSNDSLARAPDAGLLSWLVRGRGVVWAEETTHGLEDYHGTAWLLRRYHLEIAVLLLLLGLALGAWSAAATLERAPAGDGGTDDDSVAAAPLPASAGLARLLRRALPPADVIAYSRELAGRRYPDRLELFPPPPGADADEDAIVEYYRQARAAAVTGKDKA